MIWVVSWQNQQNGMCAQRRLGSAWADSLSAWRKLGSLATHWGITTLLPPLPVVQGFMLLNNSFAFFGHSSFLIAVLLSIYFSGLKLSLCQTPSASLKGNIDITSPGKYFSTALCSWAEKRQRWKIEPSRQTAKNSAQTFWLLLCLMTGWNAAAFPEICPLYLFLKF